jgi:hypothetical protein
MVDAHHTFRIDSVAHGSVRTARADHLSAPARLEKGVQKFRVRPGYLPYRRWQAFLAKYSHQPIKLLDARQQS